MFTYLIDFLNKSVNLSEPIVLFCFAVLVLSIISLLAFLNLFFYLIVNYYLKDEAVINSLPKILVKVWRFYKLSSIVSILIECGFGVLSILTIIWLCVKIIFRVN
jgi:hypothetical protein